MQISRSEPGRAAEERIGCGKIFTDKAKDTNTKRPALGKCLKALKTDDVLTVWAA